MRVLVLALLAVFVVGVFVAGPVHLWRRWRTPGPRDEQHLGLSAEAPGTVAVGSPFEVTIEVRNPSSRRTRGDVVWLQVARDSLRAFTLVSAQPPPLRQEQQSDWEALVYPQLAPHEATLTVLRFRTGRLGRSELDLRLCSPEGVPHGSIEIPIWAEAAP